MEYYRQCTFAVNTRKAYRTHRNAYLRFCSMLNIAPVPTSTLHIILSFIHSQLNLRDSKQASFWAICLVSFFGLFRKSHLLPPSPREFSPATFFTRSDFTFRDSTLLITVRWSKTIQFRQRIVTIPLVALPSIFYPGSAVFHAFSLTSGSPPSNQALCWWDSYNASYKVFTYRGLSQSALVANKLFSSQ